MVKFTLNEVRIHDVVVGHLEIGMTDPVLEAVLATSEEVVQSDHLVALHHEAIDEIGSNETSTTCHQDALSGCVGQVLDRRIGLLPSKHKHTTVIPTGVSWPDGSSLTVSRVFLPVFEAPLPSS